MITQWYPKSDVTENNDDLRSFLPLLNPEVLPWLQRYSSASLMKSLRFRNFRQQTNASMATLFTVIKSRGPHLLPTKTITSLQLNRSYYTYTSLSHFRFGLTQSGGRMRKVYDTYWVRGRQHNMIEPPCVVIAWCRGKFSSGGIPHRDVTL